MSLTEFSGLSSVQLGTNAIVNVVTTQTITVNGSITGSSNVGAISYGILPYTDTNEFATFNTSINSYAQIIISNANTGNGASADLIISNDIGKANASYVDLGMNSSQWNGIGSLNIANAAYLYAANGDMSIGTWGPTAIHLLANNSATDAITISAANIPTINNPILSGTVTIGNSSANSIINSTSFTVSNTSTAGSYKLTGGWTLNFGLVVPNSSGSNTVTFTTSFVNPPLSITVEPVANVYSAIASVNAVSNTGATLFAAVNTGLSNVGIQGLYYTAVGY